MKDILGVEVEKGDLVLNYYYNGGAAEHRFGMVVDWTKSNLIVGPPKKSTSWHGESSRTHTHRPMFALNKCIVVNQFWSNILLKITENPPIYQFDEGYYVLTALKHYKIKPNLLGYKLPEKIGNNYKQLLIESENELSEI